MRAPKATQPVRAQVTRIRTSRPIPDPYSLLTREATTQETIDYDIAGMVSRKVATREVEEVYKVDPPAPAGTTASFVN